jgi:hypothetical protein
MPGGHRPPERLPKHGAQAAPAHNHTHTRYDAAEPNLRRPADEINTVRPRASRCGRCVLTPPTHSTLPTTRPRPRRMGANQLLTGPTPSGMPISRVRADADELSARSSGVGRRRGRTQPRCTAGLLQLQDDSQRCVHLSKFIEAEMPDLVAEPCGVNGSCLLRQHAGSDSVEQDLRPKARGSCGCRSRCDK